MVIYCIPIPFVILHYIIRHQSNRAGLKFQYTKNNFLSRTSSHNSSAPKLSIFNFKWFSTKKKKAYISVMLCHTSDLKMVPTKELIIGKFSCNLQLFLSRSCLVLHLILQQKTWMTNMTQWHYRFFISRHPFRLPINEVIGVIDVLGWPEWLPLDTYHTFYIT